MSRASAFLRRASDRYLHWCPACLSMHSLPDSWTFDGDLERPTFNPSFKHTGQTVRVDGRWTGEWVLDARGEPKPWICHYHLHGGVLRFCADCSHDMAGRDVPLPRLPD